MPHAVKKKKKARKQWSASTLTLRRVAAVLLVLLAVALAVGLTRLGISFGAVMWGVASLLLLAEALLLVAKDKVSWMLQAGLGALCVALLVTGFFQQFYVREGGELVRKYRAITHAKVQNTYPAHFDEMESLETLNMRNSTVEDFTPIRGLKSLKYIDLRGNYAFTGEEYDAMKAALPDCEIRWSVPLKGTYFDSGADGVDLRQVNLTAAELRELFTRFPDMRFAYRVTLLGNRFAPDTQVLDLHNCEVDVAAIEDALMMLPAVTEVDLRGVSATPEQVAHLVTAFPEVHFVFTCDVPREPMTTDDAYPKVTGTGQDLMPYLEYLDYMPYLGLLDASEIVLSSEEADVVLAHRNADKVRFSLYMFDRKIAADATELNLDGANVPDVASMEECIAHMPNLERVSLLDAGLSMDQCGRLFDAHPDIKFVFWIEFGKYRIRTDVTAFTTGLFDGNTYGYNDATFEPLRYCTDLMMLDLGHNRIKTLDTVSTLTKLRVLVLADNKLRDISDITKLKDLEYVELFLNHISDPTPLTQLEHLMDLNLYYNPIGENYKVLKSMTQLKRLWIGGCKCTKDMLADLRKSIPGLEMDYKGPGSTDNGWRDHPHYQVLRQMYQEGRYIPFAESPPA